MGGGGGGDTTKYMVGTNVGGVLLSLMQERGGVLLSLMQEGGGVLLPIMRDGGGRGGGVVQIMQGGIYRSCRGGGISLMQQGRGDFNNAAGEGGFQ